MIPIRMRASTIIAMVTGRRNARRVGFTHHLRAARIAANSRSNAPASSRGCWGRRDAGRPAPGPGCRRLAVSSTRGLARCRAAPAPGNPGGRTAGPPPAGASGLLTRDPHWRAIAEVCLAGGDHGLPDVHALDDLGVRVVRDAHRDGLQLDGAVVDHEDD